MICSRQLWPDVAVTDNALTQGSPRAPTGARRRSVEADLRPDRRRRGYRFIAPVTTTAATQATTARVPASAADTGPLQSTEQPPAIAVLDFTNVSNDRELAWLSSGIAETVTNDLRATSPLRVVDRMRVVEAVRRGGPDLSALRPSCTSISPSSEAFSVPARWRITARVVDAASGEATAEAKAETPRAGLRTAGPIVAIFGSCGSARSSRDRLATPAASRHARSPKDACG